MGQLLCRGLEGKPFRVFIAVSIYSRTVYSLFIRNFMKKESKQNMGVVHVDHTLLRHLILLDLES